MPRKTSLAVKEVAKETLYNSIAQACIKVYETPRISLKIYWLACIVCTSSLASYLVIQSILSYFSFEVTTTSRTIFETPTHFPKVTICNLSPFTSQNAFIYLQNIIKRQEPKLNFFLNSSEMNNLSNTQKARIFQEFYALTTDAINESNEPSIQKQMSRSLDDTLLLCLFDQQLCSPVDFTWSFDSRNGNCFSFNSGLNATNHRVNIKKSTFSGESYGLQLVIYAGLFENLTLFNYGTGVKILIENGTYQTVKSKWLKLSTGLEYSLYVEREFQSHMSKPYSECEILPDTPKSTVKSRLYDLIVDSAYEYTQELCLIQCIQQKFIDECNCSTSMVISLFGKRNCSDAASVACNFRVYRDKQVLNAYIKGVCMPQCPLECSRIEYKNSFSSIQMITENLTFYLDQNTNLMSDFIRRPISKQTASENIVKINIFYNALSYRLSTESPKMDIASLLSNIGGTLGLLLGVSLFSLCEVVAVFIEILNVFSRNNVANAWQ